MVSHLLGVTPLDNFFVDGSPGYEHKPDPTKV